MANKREGIKQSLLLGFIALNVVLILLIWADNLIEKPADHGFVRTTNGATTTVTPTTPSAPVAEHQNTPSPFPDIPQVTGAPTETPTPHEDSGDIGMLLTFPNPSLAGS